MSISIYKSRLIDKMISNRSHVFSFIIGSFWLPHGKSDLDPSIGKTSVSMLGTFSLVASFLVLFLSPDAWPGGTLGKLLKGVSTKFIGAFPEAHRSGLPRRGCIWSSAKELLSFISMGEVSGRIEYQKFGSQDVASARKRLENMTMWRVIHEVLDLDFVLLDLLG